MIIRPDKKVTWMITPEDKTYMEMPYQSEDKTFEEWTPEKEKKATLLGQETVSGIACKKFETVEDGEKTTLWVSTQFPFPIKVEDSEVTMEYRNIKLGPLAGFPLRTPGRIRKDGYAGNSTKGVRIKEMLQLPIFGKSSHTR